MADLYDALHHVYVTSDPAIENGYAYNAANTLSVATAKSGTIRVTTPAATAAAATLTTDMTNATADITLTAVTAGAEGNDISVAYVDPSGNDQALAVVVSGKAITVNLATGPAGAITSTAALVKAAINASAAASALVTAEDEGTGTGVVNAVAAANLTGGTDVKHVRLQSIAIQSTYAVTASLYEGATLTGTEVSVEPRNRNRTYDDDASVQVRTCTDATLAATTTVLAAALVPAGNNAATLPLLGSIELDPATSYTIGIANASGSTAAISYAINWLEY